MWYGRLRLLFKFAVQIVGQVEPVKIECAYVSVLDYYVRLPLIYETPPGKEVVYVLPISLVLGRLPVVQYGDMGTIPQKYRVLLFTIILQYCYVSMLFESHLKSSFGNVKAFNLKKFKIIILQYGCVSILFESHLKSSFGNVKAFILKKIEIIAESVAAMAGAWSWPCCWGRWQASS